MNGSYIIELLNVIRFDCRMWEQLKRRSSYQALPTVDTKKPTELFRELHHPIFQSIRIVHVSCFFFFLLNMLLWINRNVLFLHLQIESTNRLESSSFTQSHTIVTLTKVITPPAMLQCLRFIYAGTIDKECSNLKVSKFSPNQLQTIEFRVSESYVSSYNQNM